MIVELRQNKAAKTLHMVQTTEQDVRTAVNRYIPQTKTPGVRRSPLVRRAPQGRPLRRLCTDYRPRPRSENAKKSQTSPEWLSR